MSTPYGAVVVVVVVVVVVEGAVVVVVAVAAAVVEVVAVVVVVVVVYTCSYGAGASLGVKRRPARATGSPGARGVGKTLGANNTF